jgi:hypothetical protein
MDLGALAGGTLRGVLHRDWEPGSVILELFVAPVGEMTPMWSAKVPRAEPLEATSGRVTFQATSSGPTTDKYGSPLPSTASDPLATLSGTLEWSCAGWQGSQSAGPAQRAGLLDLRLTTGATTGFGGELIQCFAGPDGSLSAVNGGSIGTLQDVPIAIELSFAGAPHPGGEAMLSLRLTLKDPPAGAKFIPSWVGQVHIATASADGLSGSLSFVDLPTGVDPSVGPAPAGWPATLSGSLDWACKAG